MIEETDVPDLFGSTLPLREPSFPSVVDAALRDGERLLRRRRWQAFGSAAVAVPLLAWGALALSGLLHHGPATPEAAARPTQVVAGSPGDPAWTGGPAVLALLRQLVPASAGIVMHPDDYSWTRFDLQQSSGATGGLIVNVSHLKVQPTDLSCAGLAPQGATDCRLSWLADGSILVTDRGTGGGAGVTTLSALRWGPDGTYVQVTAVNAPASSTPQAARMAQPPLDTAQVTALAIDSRIAALARS